MQSLSGQLMAPLAVRFAPDGRLLAVSGFGVEVWDTREGTCVLPMCARSAYFGWDVAFTPDGRRLMLANGGLGWVAIDPATGATQRLAELARNSPQAMDTDGHFVAFATVVTPITAVGPWRSVNLWAYRTDTDPYRQLWSCKADAALISRVRVVPDGDTIVCIEYRAFQAEGPTNKTALVLRGRTDGHVRAEAPVPAEGAASLAVSRDGRWAAVCPGSGSSVLLWDLNDLQRKPRRLVGPTRKHVRCGAFSPGGRILAVGGNDGRVTFWDAIAGKPIESFDWGLGRVGAVGFAPDGLRCAACDDRGRVVIWDCGE